ncbi:hypothetical protein [Granulosicoccus sp. 3-233]|uniref:hypothetical protein n=1 Tax=Granulosicoccus sp. 3-233 TaxID=3417969 RepID=UPI003D34682B
MTLLRDCVRGEPGQRLLIVSEPEGSGFYDDAAPKVTAAAGRFIGMRVYQTQSECFLATAEDRELLLDLLRGFDHIVFFSRVGDQIRFSADKDMPSSTMCYTLDLESLNSAFGTACYRGMCAIKEVIENALLAAQHIRVSCPLGTDYEGYPQWPSCSAGDVRIKRFPMLVPRPIPAEGFHGKIVLDRFLVGTGSQFYQPYHLPLHDTVFAHIENNRILDFTGPDSEVKRVRGHYAHVSQLYDIDPDYVHSWHAGIHPGCHFPSKAESDILRWSGTAFGNPRILHFHTCGNYAPGEISWNILDPTIRIDDVPIWDKGWLQPERLPGIEPVLEDHPQLLELYRNPHRNVGMERLEEA